ncbi:hypothetical protein GOODEAATRI_030091 [Goodea atripinnis]|uniref:Secreted protein n=1 Tax=Goodea atripinnis TaxID=208336 RepID=A0ABV0Q285_9TELE
MLRLQALSIHVFLGFQALFAAYMCQNPRWLCAGYVCAVLFFLLLRSECDGQVLLQRCSASESNQLGYFREWGARGRRQLVFVHSVVNSSTPASSDVKMRLFEA